jgi:hypothetical protein
MVSYNLKNLVDNTWFCSCGALNAAYLVKCGNCEKEKD